MTTLAEQQKIQEGFMERMDEDELLNCMRCGFCLPSCPTYIESGFQEIHSPRGRIALMKAVKDGMIEPDEDVERSLSLCLGCRACEPVCPSGVKYGHLLEEARDIIQQNKKQKPIVRAVRNTVFEGLFPHQNRMQSVTGLLGFYQRSGLQKVTRKIGFMKLFPESLATMEKVLPKVPTMKEMKNRPEYLPAEQTQAKRVAFFTGCLMDTMFLETNNATLKLLQKAGCEIIIPKTQGCCGALHGHSGEKEKSIELAKRNIEAFEHTNADYIITNAGGCGAFLIDYDHLLKNDPEWYPRAKAFKEKLKDITQILVELNFHKNNSLKLAEQIITYQDSCHLRNVMKTSEAPRVLLQSIIGADYREMKDSDRCCGSAGIYNIVESEMSMKILDSKMKNAKATKATTIVTANPGCLLQMKLGIEREGLTEQVRAVHIVDLLMEAVTN
ncbi:glycolate oxidase [Heyndrickxia sporothermodurans]|uniref:Glycolate oxidase iron-sulfur subunit n=1 Tax=Heyndrickxia sporothermodurans TaxID=46224 RepID=A0AB37H703_9BACI|nr:(Fe-S)-binding protein [Heyndrickxia sporothermodurans]MBL5767191.1 (Fe-S)-binding protein [Heyndrickxia sporothermodurans]MBL5770690.1 (Fe-S)-binding protein [Heyndrickxia sporothermodurans]MBL5774342.1 (Fe-S)-binding protein [Heyndrickxia sporothermodurans]MBL5779449.1 (Fe-S)-binding protein [Heyndrickxia sporothermodurans]MBL5781462.1 (Fe-S)-binding protein [Heyndrickxia sporothermodurans]